MLYLVATPIGNLKDITLRALEVLKAADLIACEDTRHTGRLLEHFDIKKPLVSFHEHSGPGRVQELAAKLEQGTVIALVSDAGTPLLSDPGFPLVREALRRGIRVESLPGPSACLAALLASGLPPNQFSFFGFLAPKSSQRKKNFEQVRERPDTLVYYESPYRVLKFLEEALEVLGDREAAVARELTKKFEEVARGRLSQLVEKFKKQTPRGEFVIVIAGHNQKSVFDSAPPLPSPASRGGER